MDLFTVRVYGIMINEKKQVLVSDEHIRGGLYTKYPGGGLEFGEGTLECIVREWREEVGQDVEVVSHLYTTDFFQMNAFRPGQQIIAIYYLVKALSPFKAPLLGKPFGFPMPEDPSVQVEGLRWVDWEDYSAETVTLPTDKKVTQLVKERF
ncbi:NUDIX domain-containing protein [Chitinophaga sp. GCM10012297]|uniref:NUDIX domain-containing protein n=1 Tax=Chitinophaga chungangae TaxID=2821488 RepID=A0ABS3YBM8_9BACT|nr:NUDIX domain-containing protein [Chitinophaga chungangae]MBO9151885.1 NUDIX domain-containing protein [Chitinophaga chungangae]